MKRVLIGVWIAILMMAFSGCEYLYSGYEVISVSVTDPVSGPVSDEPIEPGDDANRETENEEKADDDFSGEESSDEEKNLGEENQTDGENQTDEGNQENTETGDEENESLNMDNTDGESSEKDMENGEGDDENLVTDELTGESETDSETENKDSLGMDGEDESETLMEEEFVTPEPVKRDWTIVVYMSADNNLEAEAMSDFCEMEFSALDTSLVSVLVLVDRSASYDTSNGNWSTGRLYELVTGRQGWQNELISKEIDCPQLGLKVGSNTELNMASPYVLSSLMDFAVKEYTADNYGLIMWGHGTGWRGEAGEEEKSVSEKNVFKAFAYDSSSNEYMSLQDLKFALSKFRGDSKLAVLGFDSCFGCEMEVLYELKDSAKLFVGSEGLVNGTGWNYETLLNCFEESSRSGAEFCHIVVEQFRRQYTHKSGASICAIDLELVEKTFNSFENFMKAVCNVMDNGSIRDYLMNEIINSSVMYSYGVSGSDVYIDLLSLVSVITKALNEKRLDLSYKRDSFFKVAKEMIIDSWSCEEGECGPGIFFGVLAESGLFACRHPAAYIKGKTSPQISFVEDSQWYVPFKNTGYSFLDKLFYVSKWE